MECRSPEPPPWTAATLSRCPASSLLWPCPVDWEDISFCPQGQPRAWWPLFPTTLPCRTQARGWATHRGLGTGLRAPWDGR